MEIKSKQGNVISQKSLVEFFKETVAHTIKRQSIKTNEMIEFYIVNLLSEFVSTKKVYEKVEGMEDEPVGILFLKTFHSSLNEQVKIFKKVGDFSLFISGFFSDSLRNKLVHADYYSSIGKKSYNKLSLILKSLSKGETFFDLFQELSVNFKTFADIIANISAASFMHSDRDIIRIYERWLHDRNKIYENLLKKNGIIPITSGSKNIPH